ncbi:hypothetical protein Pint_22696 [Pistacia integerrima]|uniref:Uncharacterized protein n=1 Tax=Pistacia integerrima TaxID=434235 RepID=A0ACC0YJ82_9ROSI|nr:hypothetical protein Pint_22696 [Pistacia integerrima]
MKMVLSSFWSLQKHGAMIHIRFHVHA